VNIIRGQREHAEAEHADGGGVRALGRRSVLGGIAAVPVVYGIGAATTAQAATAARPGSVSTIAAAGLTPAAGDLARGTEQRYNLPLLAPGTRLVLPTGIKAVAVEDYYRRPHLASAQTAWPRMTAADGSKVDASIVPAHGAATRVAVLSGFRAGQGWFELIPADKGTARRVTWDAAKFPYLFIHGEFGAAAEAPFDRFFTLALQPFSANPYSRSTPAR
jgi:hypothetical protein